MPKTLDDKTPEQIAGITFRFLRRHYSNNGQKTSLSRIYVSAYMANYFGGGDHGKVGPVLDLMEGKYRSELEKIGYFRGSENTTNPENRRSLPMGTEM